MSPSFPTTTCTTGCRAGAIDSKADGFTSQSSSIPLKKRRRFLVPSLIVSGEEDPTQKKPYRSIDTTASNHTTASATVHVTSSIRRDLHIVLFDGEENDSCLPSNLSMKSVYKRKMNTTLSIDCSSHRRSVLPRSCHENTEREAGMESHQTFPIRRRVKFTSPVVSCTKTRPFIQPEDIHKFFYSTCDEARFREEYYRWKCLRSPLDSDRSDGEDDDGEAENHDIVSSSSDGDYEWDEMESSDEDSLQIQRENRVGELEDSEHSEDQSSSSFTEDDLCVLFDGYDASMLESPNDIFTPVSKPLDVITTSDEDASSVADDGPTDL